MTNRAPLWVCPGCGRSFANRNQSHACGRYDLEHHFQNKPPAIRALYDRFASAVASIGPVTVLPEKTRIAFQVRMSFAQVTPRRQWLDGHVVLARRRHHPRFRRIDTISRKTMFTFSGFQLLKKLTKRSSPGLGRHMLSESRGT